MREFEVFFNDHTRQRPMQISPAFLLLMFLIQEVFIWTKYILASNRLTGDESEVELSDELVH